MSGGFLDGLSRFLARRVFGKPEFEELIRQAHPTPRSYLYDTLNQLAFALRLPWVYQTTSITVEPTNTCNLRCTTCPLSGRMKRARRLMDFGLYRRIVEENPRVDRLVLSNWGEPLIHPRIFEMIALAAEQGKETMITTNALLLDGRRIADFLRSGISRVRFSVDGDPETHRRIRGVELGEVRERILEFLAERDRGGYRTKVDVSIVLNAETERVYPEFRRAWEPLVDFVNVQPWVSFREPGRRAACRELWRNVVVLSDGKVVPCCMDFEGFLEVGDAGQSTIEEIVNGPAYRRLRRRHLRGDFGFCNVCTEYGSELISPRFS